jgi:hypothetical protein
MIKGLIAMAAAASIACLATLAMAQQGTSSSYGTVGWGPVVPTQSLTNKQRDWNHDNQARYQSEDAAEYLRVHGLSPFAFF